MELSAQTHFSQGWNTKLLKDIVSLGTDSIRDSVPWGFVEARKGHYNFDHRAAEWVNKALAADIEVTLTFNPKNKNYDGGHTVHTDKGRAAFADFVVATLKAFPGVSAIEIGNEFNTNDFVSGPIKAASKEQRDEYYTKIVAAVDRALEDAGIDIEVIGASTHSIPVDYFSALKGSGAFNHVDAISIHPYSSEPEEFAAQLAVVREKIGDKIDIHVTEFGDSFDNLGEAPAFLAKMVAVMAEAGVASANWYAFARQSFFPNMELWDQQADRATPAGVTFKLLEQMLANNAQVERVASGSDTYFYTFGEDSAILWGEPRSVTLAEGVTAYNLAGRRILDLSQLSPDTPIILKSSTGNVSDGVTIGESPLLADSYHDFDLTGSGGPWTYFAENGQGKMIELTTQGGGHNAGEPWKPYIGLDGLKPFQISAGNLTPVDFSPNKNKAKSEFDTVERYTAAESGEVVIRGHWDVSDSSADGVLLKIEVNGRAVFSQVIFDKKSGHVFDLELTGIALNAGDTIDFIIDARDNAKGDVTERKIQIFDAELLELLGFVKDAGTTTVEADPGLGQQDEQAGGGTSASAPLALSGTKGDDILIGRGGKDKIKGSNGDDELFGEDGNDRLFGGNGDDILNGGAGNDSMAGGRGSDVFVFEGSFGRDTIRDFTAGDRIDLSAFEEIDEFADLEISYSGKKATISIGDSKIQLLGIHPDQLAEDDFIF